MIPMRFPDECRSCRTRDRVHEELQHRRQRVEPPRRVAPLRDAACQRLGRAEPAFRRAQQDQAAVGRDRPAREIGGHLLTADGWKIERQQAMFGLGGALRSRRLARWSAGYAFLPKHKDLRYVRHHIDVPPRMKRAK